VSYRTFKHLLGETSLERKCRFIFGGGLWTLVALSFFWYGMKTEQLIVGQMNEAARKLIPQIVGVWHAKQIVERRVGSLLDAFTSNQPEYASRVLVLDPKAAAETRPQDDFERFALARFLETAKAQTGPLTPGGLRAFRFANGAPTEFSQTVRAPRPEQRDGRVFQYVQAVLFQPDCLNSGCHEKLRQDVFGRWAAPRVGDLALAVVVKQPMDRTDQQLNRNRAILISTALVTAILAMLASWVIVKYIVVKPVKHLRDVSNAIAAGKLNIRSQIQTGDEFEELSHAFNRMLHNLVAMQQELRNVNADLDKKVDELAQANMALFEMNRLKSDFLATMSHELRTPLNSIIGFSEVLSSNEALPERQRRYATNIQTSGKMLLAMINDILDLAKIESGKMEVRVEDFSVRDVCEGLAGLMRPIADRKSIELATQLDEAIPLLRQDPGKIRQIIYNLLSNALKFTPEGGKVTLKAAVDGRQVVLAVSDTGIGIAEEDRERIFEKFRQVQPGAANEEPSVLTREHQGTGLGLSIVRELCRLLGGDVRLESQLGRGSVFTVRLPLQLAAGRRFEVTLADERVDLSKARRIETRSGPGPHLDASAPTPPRRIGNDVLTLEAPPSATSRGGGVRPGSGSVSTGSGEGPPVD
jgi:signal transduction histidine kinase